MGSSGGRERATLDGPPLAEAEEADAAGPSPSEILPHTARVGRLSLGAAAADGPPPPAGLDVAMDMLPIASHALASRLGPERAGQVHVAPLLSAAECADLIDLAERHGAWGSRPGPGQRHRSYSIADVESGGRRVAAQSLRDLPGGTKRLETLFLQRLAPFLSTCFDVPAQHLWPSEVFVIKYDASPGVDAPLSLSEHKDSSIVSFNLLLSPAGDFDGGGTQFTCLPPPALCPEQGECIAHIGQLPHSGAEITSGQRYILVGFCVVRAPWVAQLMGRLQRDGVRPGEIEAAAACFAALKGQVVRHPAPGAAP